MAQKYVMDTESRGNIRVDVIFTLITAESFFVLSIAIICLFVCVCFVFMLPVQCDRIGKISSILRVYLVLSNIGKILMLLGKVPLW